MLVILAAAVGCSTKQYTRPEVKIVPEPAKVVNADGVFVLNEKTPILVNEDNPELKQIAGFLTEQLSDFYGLNTSVDVADSPQKRAIFIGLDKSLNLGKEAYNLSVTPKQIVLKASAPNGLFYGVQTLIQLLPPSRQQLTEAVFPAVEIEDAPRFSWRGMHLDVGRHFMPVDFVKKYIDYIAMNKMNVFHWHLTEDQGWRIEIKKYPKLTEIGSKRKETIIGHAHESKEYDGTPYGGFYTQDEIKDVVAYAKARYVTVVPEIELPGHALAALASYPELGCTGGPYEVATTWGVFDDVYCAGKENTFKFLEDVISEVMPLFPGEYFHIGGDECPKTQWKKCPYCQARMKKEGLKNEHELQSYFVQRIEKFLNEHGKKMIGWDEILEGGLAPNATVMSWRGEEGGIAAAQAHHDAVMTPGNYCYFDHYQADPKTQPLAIGGLTPLKEVYEYEPIPKELSAEEGKYILGAQGNVWTEYMKTPERVEYMVFPRIAALAEVVWSPKASRNYDDFMSRMQDEVKRYDALGINYCKVEFQ
ncbi:hexosaminidase [Prolixibacter denitrificans]|nr:hexosaminidase [Prolixibacter denitrificans]